MFNIQTCDEITSKTYSSLSPRVNITMLTSYSVPVDVVGLSIQKCLIFIYYIYILYTRVNMMILLTRDHRK